MNPQTPTTTQLTLGVTREKKLWTDNDDEENDTFSAHVSLDDVTFLEAAELDAIALLADTWDDDLDPEVSAQLVHNRCKSLPFFWKEKGKGKGKSKGKGKGRYLVRPSHLSLEDRRRRLKELKAKTVVLVVERDIGQMIANVHCPLPTRLQETRHVQLVWRHVNSLPTKRIRLKRVSFSTTLVTIPIHPHI